MVPLRDEHGRRDPAVEVRGPGAYIVVAPSRTAGGCYSWAYLAPVEPAPAWLVESASSPSPNAAAPALASVDMTTPYGAAVIAGVTDRLADARPGNRHPEVWDAARTLGGYVGGGQVVEAEALAALDEGALALPLAAGERPAAWASEARRTIRAGLAAGMSAPLRAPTTRGARR